MEVWWTGFIAKPFQLIMLLMVTYLLLLGYNRFAGMRTMASWRSVMIDSVEEMGISFVISFGMLLMLRRIELQNMAIDEIMGKIIVEAMGVAIGVSIGTAQLGDETGEEKSAENEDNAAEENKEGMKRSNRGGMLVLALCGSILIGSNVAPTEEVLMLAVEATSVNILFMALVSLALSVMVMFFSSFKGTARERPKNFIYELTFDTCLSYLIALASSAFVLWFFGRFTGVSFEVAFAQVIVLGVLASLGASAGRLLIK